MATCRTSLIFFICIPDITYIFYPYYGHHCPCSRHHCLYFRHHCPCSGHYISPWPTAEHQLLISCRWTVCKVLLLDINHRCPADGREKPSICRTSKEEVWQRDSFDCPSISTKCLSIMFQTSALDVRNKDSF